MITAIIPARGGSKGIPEKNIVDIQDFPLIAYSIAACHLSKNIDQIIVSTDNEKIANISKSYGAEVPFLRPPELSSDESTDVGFLRHFFENIDVNEAVLLRPTTPFRDPVFLDETIETFFDICEKISSLRTVEPSKDNPYKLFKIEEGKCQGFFEDFRGTKNYSNLPRQMFPDAYTGNGYIDIVMRRTVYSGSTYGNIISPVITDRVVDIDSYTDLEAARSKNLRKNVLWNFLKEKK